MKKNIICLGNIAFDLLEKRPASDKILLEANAGGSVLNTSVILRNLGAPVTVVSRTGHDLLGSLLTSFLSKTGIDTSHVIRDPGVKTPLALARLDKNGDSSYTFYSGGSKTFPADVSSSLLKNSFLIHTGSMFSYADETFPATIKYLREARKNGLIVTYDPNWRPERVKNHATAVKRIHRILEHTGILKLNGDELKEITGEPKEKASLKCLSRLFKGHLFVTLGDDGAYYWDGKKKLSVPSFRVNVADTIGAGDAFSAGIIKHITSSGGEIRDPFKTLLFASAVSALSCTKHGGTDGVRSLSQVRRFLRKNM